MQENAQDSVEFETEFSKAEFNENDKDKPLGEFRQSRLEEIKETIRGLEEPTKNLLEQLRDDIENGTYESLLGDDVSARLPTLVMRKVINTANERNGRSPIKTRFFAGGGDIQNVKGYKAVVQNYLQEVRPNLGKKTLLVEEFSYAGSGLKETADILKEMGLEFDIVLFATVFKDKEVYQKQLPKGVKLFIGLAGRSPGDWKNIWDEKEASGTLGPEETGEIKSGYAKAEREGRNGREFLEEQKKIAREEADALAVRLVDWYESGNVVNEILDKLDEQPSS